MRDAEFRLEHNNLVCGIGSSKQSRPLSDSDWVRFGEWVRTYHELAWRPRNEAQLLELGRRIHDWLDVPELRRTPGDPVVPNFAVPLQITDPARLFLEVPWEIIADDGGHLAADPGVMWAPLRRIGARSQPLSPNGRYRFGMMFMAAAPLGQKVLDFDLEETAILHATEHAGLDLVVDDSGNFDELRAAWQYEGSLDALHLSCHGVGGLYPAVVLESPAGEPEAIGFEKLASAFGVRLPRLLFLSACHTGQNDAAVDSFALGLVGAGFPAVLAWADAVNDKEASVFASSFYAEAAHSGTSLEAAWAAARCKLLHPLPGGQSPAHWHLARLFLGPRGGGPLATGRSPRLPTHPDAGRKGIVNARGARIEVASRFEFVGRRREIQTIAREFHHPEHAGVLIQGFGRQGKSSLAARIMDRHPHLASVVLFQRCDGPSLLAEIRQRVATAGEICEQYCHKVDPSRPEYDPQGLYDALRALLEGPCARVKTGKPILLVLDDFEVLLDPPVGAGEWCVKPDAAVPFRAIIRAFDDRDTDSRLLVTSRYVFRVGNDATDTASPLLDISLPEMSPANRLKQGRQKLLTLGHAGPAELPTITLRVISAARGNAGLQDLLFQTAMADPIAGEAAVCALEAYLGGGALPEQEELRETLEKLTVDQLIEPLTDPERVLLRASTLFKLPVPLAVWEKFADSAGFERPDRLLAFGLWGRHPDVVNPKTEAAAINAIAAARLPALPSERAIQIIHDVLEDLFVAWGGAQRAQMSFDADIELTRLALLSRNLHVLDATALPAIRGLEQAFDYRAASSTASAILDAFAAADRVPSIQLLRAAAEVSYFAGDSEGLRRAYARASEFGSDDPSASYRDRLARAQFRARYGDHISQLGEPDAGLQELNAALSVFYALDALWEQAGTLSHIARVMRGKGQVDDALKLHQEELRIVDALGDLRARGIALGDIARIMTDKGQVDQALKIHQEQLQIAEAFQDRRSQGVLLGDIARIMESKGEVHEALKLHQEQLQIVEAIGERRGRAVALGDIARIITAQGQIDEALKLHREILKIYAALQDPHGRAVALGDIAEIMSAKGEFDKALKLHQREIKIYEALGAPRDRAVALGDIARIMTRKGEIDEAMRLHQQQLETYEALGERRSWAMTLGHIARILRDKGEEDEALKLHQQQLAVFEKLGDPSGRGVALSDIARIMRGKGQLDEALKLHQENLQIIESQGNPHARASVLGDIAVVLADKGELGAAIELHQERLDVYRQLGDQEGIAIAGCDIGETCLPAAIENHDEEALRIARESLIESFTIFSEIGRLDGTSFAGNYLGMIFIKTGQRDEARQLLRRSLDGFRKLGLDRQASGVENLLSLIPDQPSDGRTGATAQGFLHRLRNFVFDRVAALR